MSSNKCWKTLLLLVVFVLCGVFAETSMENVDKIQISTDKSKFLTGPGETDAWFEQLNTRELRSYWSTDEDLVFNKKMKKIQQFESVVFIEVRLVGLNGDGYRKFNANEEELLRFLEASGLNQNKFPYVINDESKQHSIVDDSIDEDVSVDFDKHRKRKVGTKLPTKRKFMFKVTNAPSSLNLAVQSKVMSIVQDQAKHHSEFRRTSAGSHLAAETEIWYHIPHKEMLDQLKEDYGSTSTYVIYILSPSAPFLEVPVHAESSRGAQVGGNKKVAVRYMYSDLSRLELLKNLDATTTTQLTCETTLYAADRRFAYIDLTAGPVTYGSRVNGDGIFTELSLPNLDRLFSRHSEDKKLQSEEELRSTRGDTDGMHNANVGNQFQTSGSRLKTAVTHATINKQMTMDEKVRVDYLSKVLEFTAGLAQVVRKTTESLLIPPLARFPVRYYDKVVVNVVTVTDHEFDRGDVFRRWEQVADKLQTLGLEFQDVQLDVTNVLFEDCELCVNAFTNSLRTHTSNVITQKAVSNEYDEPTFKTKVHQYLDSNKLIDWLEHYEKGFWSLRKGKADEIRRFSSKRNRNTRYGGGSISPDSSVTSETISETETTKDGGLDVRVITVYVFDVSAKDPILLDRQHQAVSKGDVVVAIQTQAPTASLDAVCNGRTLQITPNNAARAVLASLLETIWGVVPPGTIFEKATNTTFTDLMWSGGMNPFGRYSQGLDLHFGIVDSIHRNQVITDVVDGINLIEESRLAMKAHMKSIEDIVDRETYQQFMNRYNLFQYKLQKVQHLISVNDYNQALFYSRSSRHDAYVISDIIFSALKALEPTMVCASEVKSGSNSLSDTIGSIGGLSAKEHSLYERAKATAILRKKRLQRDLDRRLERNKQAKVRKTALSKEMNNIESYLSVIEDHQTLQSTPIWVILVEIVVSIMIVAVIVYFLLINSVAAGNNDAVTRFGADMLDMNPREAGNKECCNCFKKKKYNRYE